MANLTIKVVGPETELSALAEEIRQASPQDVIEVSDIRPYQGRITDRQPYRMDPIGQIVITVIVTVIVTEITQYAVRPAVRHAVDWLVEMLNKRKKQGKLQVENLDLELLEAMSSKGFDLRLMPSVDDVGVITTVGNSLIIVASVKNVLHFRIFDRDGQTVVDTDETKTTQPGTAEGLRKQLESLWPPHELTESEKDLVIATVKSIVDPAP